MPQGGRGGFFSSQINAELSRPTFERSQLVLLMLSLIAFSAQILIGHVVFEHKVNDAGNAVSRSDHSLGWAKNSPFATIESPKGRVAAAQGSGGLTESLTGPVTGFKRVGPKDFTAGNAIARRQPQPGSKLFDRRKTGHIGAKPQALGG